MSFTERTRAQRYRFFKDREAYVIRHGILRTLLGGYLEIPPSEVEFSNGPFGKPEITGDAIRDPFHISASHSGDLALFAVTRACPIGVDVEHVRPVPHFEEIASRFFSRWETETLRALSTESRMEAFFACWTRKEAYLKATGEGIGEGLARVEVSVNPWDDAQVLKIAGESGAQTGWQLRSSSPAAGYLAALAFKYPGVSVCWWKVSASFDYHEHFRGLR